jgi:hypothetical protein
LDIREAVGASRASDLVHFLKRWDETKFLSLRDGPRDRLHGVNHREQRIAAALAGTAINRIQISSAEAEK